MIGSFGPPHEGDAGHRPWHERQGSERVCSFMIAARAIGCGGSPSRICGGSRTYSAALAVALHGPYVIEQVRIDRSGYCRCVAQHVRRYRRNKPAEIVLSRGARDGKEVTFREIGFAHPGRPG